MVPKDIPEDKRIARFLIRVSQGSKHKSCSSDNTNHPNLTTCGDEKEKGVVRNTRTKEKDKRQTQILTLVWCWAKSTNDNLHRQRTKGTVPTIGQRKGKSGFGLGYGRHQRGPVNCVNKILHRTWSI